MTSPHQYAYLTKMIRAGYEKADVDMFAALCQQAKTDIGESREYLFVLLDMARHNDCDVLDVVKTGRTCSGQKAINKAFMDAVFKAVSSDDDDSEPSTKVLDLTCEESLEDSGSYEEEPTNPTSAEAYAIDDEAKVASTGRNKRKIMTASDDASF